MRLYRLSSLMQSQPNPRRIAWTSIRRWFASGPPLGPCQIPFKSNSERSSGAMTTDGHSRATCCRNTRKAGRHHFHSIVKRPSSLVTSTALSGLSGVSNGRMCLKMSSATDLEGFITNHSTILGLGPYRNTSRVRTDIDAISDASNTSISGSLTSHGVPRRHANSRT
jgi:hypothetical protein